jgi:hypothetical protein
MKSPSPAMSPHINCPAEELHFPDTLELLPPSNLTALFTEWRHMTIRLVLTINLTHNEIGP